jgi:hypothetical protein
MDGKASRFEPETATENHRYAHHGFLVAFSASNAPRRPKPLMLSCRFAQKQASTFERFLRPEVAFHFGT